MRVFMGAAWYVIGIVGVLSGYRVEGLLCFVLAELVDPREPRP